MRNFKKGFTLIEILLVVLIIGILVSILAVRASGISIEAKKKASMADLKTLKAAVETYYLKHSIFPYASNWDDALTAETNRIVDEVPNDPFGEAYVYETNWTGEDARFLIYSKGPNTTSGAPMLGTDEITGNKDDDIWVSNCKTNNHGGL